VSVCVCVCVCVCRTGEGGGHTCVVLLLTVVFADSIKEQITAARGTQHMENKYNGVLTER